MHLFSRDGHVPWPVAHPTVVEFDLPATVGAGDSRELSASKQLAPKLHHHVFTLTRKGMFVMHVGGPCMQRSNGCVSDCLDCRVHARSGGRADGMQGAFLHLVRHSQHKLDLITSMLPEEGEVWWTSGEWAEASGADVIVSPFSVSSVQPGKSDSKHTRDAISKRLFECACSSACGRARADACPLHWPCEARQCMC
jgi:hypothetical protein